jgi:hypothetical protein
VGGVGSWWLVYHQVAVRWWRGLRLGGGKSEVEVDGDTVDTIV